ncbi:MAG TPA: hypothetical protein VJ579_00215 [Candidatus Paceibacterota bacterium]|nr:hypothetical protein [Candidatus Paceibacterota bacterium]
MDELFISEIVLLVSANMRANSVSFEEAFEVAIADYWLSTQQRASLLSLVRSRIPMRKQPSPDQ